MIDVISTFVCLFFKRNHIFLYTLNNAKSNILYKKIINLHRSSLDVLIFILQNMSYSISKTTLQHTWLNIFL